MTDRIPALTKALLTLSLFFACATLGAGLVAKELAHPRRSNLEFETALHDTRARLGELGATVELRANSQEKKIVAELKVLETLMREFAGKTSRNAASVPRQPSRPQRGPASAYLNTLGGK